MPLYQDFQTYDPLEKVGPKGYERATRIVNYLRTCMVHIIDIKKAKINKQYLFGVQDMTEIKKMFKDPAKSGVNFHQFVIMEKIRNVLIEEDEENGIEFRLQSTDSLATNEKERDLELLSNRGWIEPLMTGVNQMMGLPPFNMNNDKSLFNGNVDQFDKMGLDSNNKEDINYFFMQHYRLLHEMVGEEPINYFLKYNDMQDLLAAFYNDVIASKAITSRAFVNEVSGSQDIKYLAPENVRALPGQRRDYKDAVALEFVEKMTVMDMIKVIGSDFDFETDMANLLAAVNGQGDLKYTGISEGKQQIFGTPGTTIPYSEFMKTYVSVGYIEWKEINASTHLVWRSKGTGRLGLKPIAYGTPEKPDSIYKKDCRYYETTYKAYYLATGNLDCKLYKYGQLSYQQVSGAEDEYSNFSIMISQEYGKSAMEICIPFIDLLEKAMKKLEYMIVRAKPPGRMWSYESLLTMSKSMFPGIPVNVAINKLMATFTDMSNEMYAIPTVNGQPVGGGGAMNYDLPHGLSQNIKEFQGLAEWCEQKIMDKLGITALRAADNVNEKDGLGLQEKSTAYSQKATAYMPRMVSRMVKNIGIRILSFTQDIIEFGDKNTIPYKFLLQALGDNTMIELGHLKKVAFHRYNIFVEGIGSAADKREAAAIAQMALSKGDITLEQWLLFKSVSSPRKAIAVLAYQKKVNDRIKNQQQQQVQDGNMQLEQARHKNKMEEINTEGKLGIDREEVRGKYLVKGQEVTADGAIEKQREKIDAEPNIIDKKNEGKIAQDTVKNSLASTQPILAK